MNTQAVLETQHSLLEGGEKLNAVRWFALYTKSRHEKLVVRELQKKGIETFLPLRKITRDWSDRKKTIEEPLFQGYLFVHMPLKERWTVLNTVGAVRFIGKSAADPIEVPEKELLTVRQFIEQEIQVDPFPYLKEGQRVYVRSGPFKGTEGIVVRKDRHCRLVISLDMLMKSISVIIDEACIEPL
jgi:transcription termination/antitermination protein NusG